MLDPLFLIVLSASYLLGAVPFGLVLTRLAGLGDIRAVGSGNIGATNVLRTGRKDLALLTLLLDAGKGGIAALFAAYLLTEPFAPSLAGALAFLGHCFPVYLQFKGGKGVATFMGTLAAIHPLLFVIAGLSWLSVALIFRISSLSALVAALAAPLATYFLLDLFSVSAVAGMAVLIYWRHRDNIKRLLAGTEPKIGAKNDTEKEDMAATQD